MTLFFEMRPAPIETDDARVRFDVISADCHRVYPFLPMGNVHNWDRHSVQVKEREKYMQRRDTYAYNGIKDTYPQLKPPLQMLPLTTKDKMRICLENFVIRFRELRRAYRQPPSRRDAGKTVRPLADSSCDTA